MGNKIAQLIFEKIKTPTIKEINDLEATGRGDRGYGSMGMNAVQFKNIQDIKNSSASQSFNSDQEKKDKSTNESIKK